MRFLKRLIGLSLIAAIPCFSLAQEQGLRTPDKLPEFTESSPENWINSKPLTLKDLKGNVVLLEFWTFACWNCYRSFPWLNDLEKRLSPSGLKVIGVHSPELEHEHDLAALKLKIKEYGVQYPIVTDNDFKYWKALGNSYWPCFYLVDRSGKIRKRFSGETHSGDEQAVEIEAAIRSLLKE